MRGFLLSLAICAALGAASGPARSASIDNILNACSDGDDGASCRAGKDEFKREWPKANRGDYGAQRNVAYCLLRGCDGAVAVDGVAACAWRTVIIASDAAWDNGDMMNYTADCAGVKRQGAEMARILFRKIYKRRMPALD